MNPANTHHQPTSLSEIVLLAQFRAFLFAQQLSKKTVKNYVSDVRRFLAFWNSRKQNSIPDEQQDAEKTITPFDQQKHAQTEIENDSNKPEENLFRVDEVEQWISEYRSHILSSATPLSTLNRRLAALKQFTVYLETVHHVSVSQTSLARISFDPNTNQTNAAESPNAEILEQFALALAQQGCSRSTIRNYLADTRQFTHFCNDISLFENQTKPPVGEYLASLSQSGASQSTIRQKQAALKKFYAWAKASHYIKSSPFDTFLSLVVESAVKKVQTFAHRFVPLAFFERARARAANSPSTSSLLLFRAAPSSTTPYAPTNTSSTIHTDQEFPLHPLAALYKKYTDWPASSYFHLAILVLFVVMLGIFGYRQFFLDAEQKYAYPSSLTTPNRVLSFQGRVTDSSQTPIVIPTNMKFRLFNHLTNGTGDGEALWASGTCSIDPDQDGIFSTLLGSDCGGAIPASVFSENRDVFLEVEVSGETLAPRQQIATVGYALNSETLQGFPASASATENTVLIMNNSGDVILGSASPNLKATSNSTFTVEGTSLALITSANTGGDITIQPDSSLAGSGSVNFVGGTDVADFIDINGGANLTTGTLIKGTVGNDNTGYKFLSFYGGATPDEKYRVDAIGNVMQKGYLEAPGATLSANYAGAKPLVIRANSGQTANITEWVGTGGSVVSYVAASGALTLPSNGLTVGTNQLVATNDSVGIGTTNPLSKLNISGNNSSLFRITNTAAGGGDWDFQPYVSGISNGGLTIKDVGANTARLVISSTGNVGIGTTSPNYQLDVVSGDAIAASFDGRVIGSNAVNTNEFVTLGQLSTGGTQYWQRPSSTGIVAPTNITDSVLVGGIATTSAIVRLPGTTNQNAFFNLGTGNLGIGTTNPTAKLEISGISLSPNVPGIKVASDIVDAAFFNLVTNYTGAGRNVMYFDKSRGSGASPSIISNGDYIGGMTWRGYDGGQYVNLAMIDARVDGTPGTNDMPGSLVFLTTTDGTSLQTEKMRINNAGNVGIGTTTPTGRLQITGDEVRIGDSGTITIATGDGDLYVEDDLEVDNTIYALRLASTFIHGNNETSANPNIIGGFENRLVRSDEKYTVTLANACSGGSTSRIFDGDGDSGCSQSGWVDGVSTQTVTIDMAGTGTPLHYWNGFRIEMAYNYSTTGVLVEKYVDVDSGDGYSCNEPDNAWSTVYSTTSNTTSYIDISSNLGSAICRYRVTFSGTANSASDTLIVAEIQGYQYYYGPSGAQFVSTTGDTVYGNLIIGTSSNTRTLTVNGSVNISSDLYDSTGFLTVNDTIDSGNINIGLNSTATLATYDTNEDLTINPNGTGSIYLHGSTYYINSSALAYLSGLATTGYTPTAGELRADVFRDGNSNYYIQPADTAISGVFAGNVGIGTTTPSQLFHVNGGTGIVGQFSGRVIGGDAVNTNEFVTLGQLSTGGTQYWQRPSSTGIVAPTNITDSVLVGGIATSSAIVRLPGTTNQNAFFNLGTGNVGIGTTTPGAKLQVSGGNIFVDSTYGIDTATAGTLSLGNTTATTVNIGNTAATTIALGAGGSLTRTINIGTGTGADTINIGTGGTTADTIAIGGSAGTTPITITSGTSGISLSSTATTGTGLTMTNNSITSGYGAHITSNSITSGNLLRLTHSTSTMTGAGLYMDFGTSSGTFTGNFLTFRNNSTTPFSVNYRGGITSTYTTATAGEAINLHNYTFINTSSSATSYSTLSSVGDTVAFQSNSSTGTDQEIDNNYEAFKIQTGSYNSLGRVRLQLKKSTTTGSNTTAYLNFYLYSDNAGSPGSLVATSANTTIPLNIIGTSYTNFDISFDNGLSSSTSYWVVIRKVGANSTDQIYINSDSSGSSEYAYGDGSTWTLDTTTKAYAIAYTRSSRGLFAASYSNADGVYGSSTTGRALYGVSSGGTAVYGVSTLGYGGYFNSGYGLVNNTTFGYSGGSFLNATSAQRAGVRYFDRMYNTGFSGNSIEIQAGAPVYTQYMYYYDGASFTDVGTQAKNPSGTAYTMIGDTNDYFYFGRNNSTSSYRNFYIDIANTPSLSGVTWERASSPNDGSACTTWESFTPSVDETNGLTRDGMVTLDTGTTGYCTVNGQAGYWFRVSASSVSTGPTAYHSSFGIFNGRFASWYGSGTERFRVDSLGNTYIAGYFYPGNAGTEGSTVQTSRYMYDTGSAIGFNTFVQAHNGTAAGPSFSFTGDTDNGMFRATTDQIGFATAGSERLRIDASGNVGIGTTAPSYQLSVVSGDAIAASFDGRVIGSNAVNTNEFVTLGQLATGGTQYWQRPSSTGIVAPTNITDSVLVGGIATSSAIVRLPGTTNQNAFFNLGTGNLGIGTTTPGAKLHIADTTDLQLRLETGSGNYWNLGRNESTGHFQIEEDSFGVAIDINNSNGNVGIGSTTPEAKLDIDSNSNTHALRLHGAAESTEIGDMYIGSAGEFIVNLTAGSDTGQFFDLYTEDDNYGLILRNSLGTSTIFANMYMNDATTDYLNIVVNNTNGTAGLVVADNDYVGIGTTAPTAGRLTVVQTTSLVTYGSELTTNGGFTSDLSGWTVGGGGTGWTYSGGTALHGTGNTDTLYQGISVTNAARYQVTVVTTGVSAGSVTMTFGSMDGSHTITSNTTTTKTFTATATETANITFTPTSTFNGAIDSVSVTVISNGSPAAFALQNADYTTGVEMRSGGTNYNTFVGTNAGRFATTLTSYSVGIGRNALENNTTGTYNTSVGALSMAANTNGYYNAALGMQALTSNTNGNHNTAIGRAAMFTNTSGSYNSAVGGSSLYYNTTGQNNTAIGYYAMNANTTASYNTALGMSALAANQTGPYGTAIGYAALNLNTGGYNTALGYVAGYYNTTGTSNVLLGLGAGYGTNGSATFSNTIAIGRDAGGVLTSGGNNILIGHSTASTLTSGANNILIGHDIEPQSITGSNQLSIGNLIFGSGIDGTTTTISSGNIGIGVTAPTAKFHVNGNTLLGGYATASASLSVGYTSVLAGVGNAAFSGNVGIGITTALAPLHVAIPASGTHILLSGNSSNAVNSGTVDFLEAYNTVFGNAGSYGFRLTYDGSENSFKIRTVIAGSASDRLTILRDTGNVGIGTTNPAAKLDVNGDIYISDTDAVFNVAGTYAFQRSGIGRISFYSTRTAFHDQSGTDVVSIASSNVGIGSTTPNYQLDVVSGDAIAASFDGRVIGSNAVNTNEFVTLGQLSTGGTQYWQRPSSTGIVAPTNITDSVLVGGIATSSAIVRLPGTTNQNAFFNLGTGNLGVGITNPNSKLQVRATSFGEGTGIWLGTSSTGGYTGLAIDLSADVGGYTTFQAIKNSGASPIYGNAVFNPNGGNVGIGSTTPSAKLDINGSLLVQGYATASASLSVGYNSITAGVGNAAFSGNVGIGLTNPANALSIYDNVGTGGNVLLETTGVGYMTSGYIAKSVTDTRGRGLYMVSAGAEANASWFAGVPYQGGGFQIGMASDHATTDGGNANGPYIKSNAKLYINTNGNVGIGTTTVSHKLSVYGNVGLNDGSYFGGGINQAGYTSFLTSGSAAQGVQMGALVVSSSYTNTAPTNGAYIQGNVGIGTTSPEGTLHVHTASAGTVTASSTADQLIVEHNSEGGISILTPDASNSNIYLGSPTNPAAGIVRWNYNDNKMYIGTNRSASDLQFKTGTFADAMIITDTGNVGIGVTNPQRQLDIVNSTTNTTPQLRLSSYLNNAVSPDELIGALEFYGQDNEQAGLAGEIRVQASNGHTTGSTSGNMLFSVTAVGSTTPTEIVRFTSAGNVGIGTTAPSYQLSVVSGDAIAASFDGRVIGSNAVNTNEFVTLGQLATGGTQYWQRPSSTGIVAPTNITDSVLVGGIATTSAIVRLPGTTNQNAFFNLGTGNLGIGTTTPGAKLEVASGNILLSNNQYIQFRDSGGTARNIINFSSSDNLTIAGVSGTSDIYIGESSSIVSKSGGRAIIGSATSNTGNKLSVSGALAVGSTYKDSSAPTNGAIIEGNVGIGTTTTRQVLDVVGSGIFTGNVGIGITNPTYKLYVAADGPYQAVLGGSANTNNRLYLGYNTTDNYGQIQAITEGTSTRALSLNPSGGNVGIGTTTPSQLFHVNGGTGIVGQFSGRVIGGDAVNTNEFVTLGQLSTGGTQYWQRPSSTGIVAPTNITDSVLVGGIATSSAIVRLPGTTNQNAFFNLGTGNVGIGTTNPNQGLLHLHQNSDVYNGGLAIQDNASNYSSYFWTTNAGVMAIQAGSTASRSITLNGSGTGNVGIGLTNPTYQLHTTGQTQLASSYATGTGQAVRIGRINGSNSWCGNGSYGCGLLIDENYSTLTGAQGYYGAFINTVHSGAANPVFMNAGHFESSSTTSIQQLEGFAGVAKLNATATLTGNMRGGYFEVGSDAAGGSTLTIANAYSVWARTGFDSAATANVTTLKSIFIDNSEIDAGTIGTYYGVHVSDTHSGGTITTGYGMYLSNISATNDWGIYQAGSDDYNYFAGNVGIGTTAPATPLQIVSTTTPQLRINNNTVNDTTYVEFSISSAGALTIDPTANADVIIAHDLRVSGGGISDLEDDILISLDNTSNNVEFIGTGNVGVGTANPTAKFHVNGNSLLGGYATVSASLAVGYDDVTEGIGNASFSGRVGVGTSAPTSPFHLYRNYSNTEGNLNLGTMFFNRGTASSTTKYTDKGLVISASSSHPGTYTGGIETNEELFGFQSTVTHSGAMSNNHQKIIYGGDISVTDSGSNTSTATTYGLRISAVGNSGGTSTAYGLYVDSQSADTNYGIYSNSGTNYFSGNVGIGSTSPAYKLDLNADINGVGAINVRNSNTGASSQARLQTINERSSNASIGFLSTYASTFTAATAFGQNLQDFTLLGSDGSNSSGLIVGTISQDPLIFGSYNTERMRILSGGNVGIGTTNPGYALEINDSGNVGGLKVNSASSIGLNVTNGSTTVLRVNTSSGYVGIGMTNPSVALDVTGDIEYTGTITDVSDMRLKENMIPLQGSLDKIMHIRPISFTMIGDNRVELGFTAQNVQEQFPALVSIVNPETGNLGLNYVGLISPIVGAIQEQQLEIASTRAALNGIIVTDIGNLSIQQQPSGEYALINTQTQTLIETIAAFGQVIVAKVEAGIVQTQELIATTLRTTNATVDNLLLARDVAVTNTLTAPVAEIDELHTNLLRPNAATSSVALALQPDSLQILNTNDPQNPIVLADIDAHGNATFSGMLQAESIQTDEIIAQSTRTQTLEAANAQLADTQIEQATMNTATISGTLYADRITAQTIDGLDDTVEEVVARAIADAKLAQQAENAATTATIAESTENTPSSGSTTTQLASPSQQLLASLLPPNDASIEAILAQMNTSLQTTVTVEELQTPKAVIIESFLVVPQLASIQNAVINQATIGSASTQTLAATTSITISNQLKLSENSIEMLGNNTLYIQPQGNGSLNLLAGAMVLSSDGTIQLTGDVTVHGSFTADTATTNTLTLRPSPITNTATDSAQPTTQPGSLAQLLQVYDERGKQVAGIDASGSATLASVNTNQMSTRLVTIAAPADNETTSIMDSVVTSNATAGSATITAPNSTITIQTPYVTEQSLIYVTPTSQTNNQVLYVANKTICSADDQTCVPSFTVAVHDPTTENITFNWWIVKLETQNQ